MSTFRPVKQPIQVHNMIAGTTLQAAEWFLVTHRLRCVTQTSSGAILCNERCPFHIHYIHMLEAINDGISYRSP